MGPEHEFSVVSEGLKALPIVDRILKDFYGRVVNFVEQRDFTFGKELQMHVLEVKPNAPFRSPEDFEESMQHAVLMISGLLDRKYKARLLGCGMHPLLRLDETGVWPHRHRQIYQAFSKLFSLKRHGWLNIQSYQLNLPYSNEESGVLLHNTLANVCAYLPAIAASSPVCEGKLGRDIDNRLAFYRLNQKEVPSITGDVVPEYVFSFNEYREKIIEKYSADMAALGADELILHKDWINSRGAVFRFDRKAVEIRVMDEQECVKSDVALSCFIRALLRGLLERKTELLPHSLLIKDFNSIIAKGLNARTEHPKGKNARQVCEHFFEIARENASSEERKYLPVVKKRIECGSLSEIIRERVERKAEKTDLKEAIVCVYSKLMKNLIDNEPYF
jgi:gamma-glutamyl:cysteine ligase YbdK (ATP-grasp superfamily)